MNPWLLAGFLAALIAAFFLGGHLNGQRVEARVTAAWQAREGTQLRAANAKILELEEAARKAERARLADLDRIATVYEGKLHDAEKQKALDIAAARSGGITLRVPGLGAPCLNAHRGDAAPTAAAPGERDGGAGAELPREVAADLLALADDADAVVQQLTACQAVVRADRAGQMAGGRATPR